MSWVQIVILLAVFVLPAISKMFQGFAEKQAEERERKRRAEAARRAELSGEGPARRFGEDSSEEQRRADLAQRRQQELEAWRTRQAARGAQTQTRTPKGAPTTRPTAPTPTSSSGNELADMLMNMLDPDRGKSATPTRGGAPPTQTQSGGASASASARPSTGTGARPVRTTVRQRAAEHHNVEHDEVHRLVRDDSSAQPKRRRPARQQQGVPRDFESSTNRISDEEIGGGGEAGPAWKTDSIFLSSIKEDLKSPDTLRKAIVFQEILSQPLALRDQQS